MIAGGVSQYSAQVGVSVVSAPCPGVLPASGAYKGSCSANPPPTPPPPCTNVTSGCTTNAQAWAVSGPGFVGVGAGIRYGITPAIALLLGPRFDVSFGSTAVSLVALSPELGAQFGF